MSAAPALAPRHVNAEIPHPLSPQALTMLTSDSASKQGSDDNKWWQSKHASSFDEAQDKAQTPSHPLFNKWWNCVLCQLWVVLQKYHRWPALLTKTGKKKTLWCYLSFFFVRLVPFRIMKVVREDFFMPRSMDWFHCHNTRRRSETGVWQMARHLRQRDVPRASVRVQMSAPSLGFSNLREIEVGATKCECVRTHLRGTRDRREGDSQSERTWAHAHREAC